MCVLPRNGKNRTVSEQGDVFVGGAELGMSGETDLDILLRSMEPELLPEAYVFVSFPGERYGYREDLRPVAAVQEAEGLTLVLEKSRADGEGMAYDGVFRCISLHVHSSLEAVGLTAAFAACLAEEGISANVVAGFYHDHIYVPASSAARALRALRTLSAA